MNGSPAHASPRRIIIATIAAMFVAIVVLVVAVLPAEYGVDPLGTGRLLGLTALSGTATDAPATPPNPGKTPVKALARLQQDTYSVELRPFEGVEYKYRLEQNAALVYSWEATAQVGYEFHGEPDGAPAKYFDSYAKADASLAEHGGFVAAKAGIHGWFWKNNSAGRITVTLHSAGFYSASTEYRDGERNVREFSEAAAAKPESRPR